MAQLSPARGLPSARTVFQRRFAFEPIETAGVLLDLASGETYALNTSAAAVCAALAGGSTRAQAARELAHRFGLSAGDARADVAAVLASLAGRRAPRSAARELSFVRAARDGAHVMRWRGLALLRIAAKGASVRLGPRCAEDPARWLRAAAPHVLALRRKPLVHAATIATRDAAVAFVGAGGAGKTTLARAAVRRGVRVVAEDLAAVRVGAAPVVALRGEAAIESWANHATGRAVDARPLDGAFAGPSLPLERVHLVDARRRSGAAIVTERLSRLDAARALLENAFAEIASPVVWRDALALAASIARAVPVLRTTVPLGLEALHAAASDYAWTSSS